jgi:hypothetical protein
MPTQSEQKALAFVAIVVLLAGAVRVVRAGGPAPNPTPTEQQGLARQAFAANSAAVAQRGERDAKGQGGRRSSRTAGKSRAPRFVAPKGRDTVPKIVGGVETVPWTNRFGFPPPSPRIDIGSPIPENPTGRSVSGPRTSARRAPLADSAPVDLDTASAALIETLPRVGPALARRIVANRDSLGPFRSIQGLRRVKGIGPATTALLRPLVTFSRQERP